MSFIRVDDPLMPRDFAGRRSFNTVFGDAVVGMRADNISVQFQYSISARDAISSSSGSGVVSHSNQQAVVAAGAAAGSAKLVSKDSVRYRPGHETIAQFTSVYISPQANLNLYHGLYNTSDGCGFGFQGTSFGVWILEGGARTFIPQASWSDDKLDGNGESGFTIDPTKVNIYMVSYGWLGIAPIIFSVFTGHKTGWVVCHVIDRVNTVLVPHLHNPTLPLSMEAVSTGSVGVGSVRSSSWRAGVIAGFDLDAASDRWFSYTVLETTLSAATQHNIFTLRNKSTYQGVNNHVRAEIAVVAFDNSSTKTYAIYGNKGATLAGNSAYADVNTADSVMEVSTGGTVTGGGRGPATVLQKDTSARIDVRGTGIWIYPGETFTFELVTPAAASGTASVSVRWIEGF